jgi:hypothetical protein
LLGFYADILGAHLRCGGKNEKEKDARVALKDDTHYRGAVLCYR